MAAWEVPPEKNHIRMKMFAASSKVPVEKKNYIFLNLLYPPFQNIWDYIYTRSHCCALFSLAIN